MLDFFFLAARKKVKQSYQESLKDVPTVRQQAMVSMHIPTSKLKPFLFHFTPNSISSFRKRSSLGRRERDRRVMWVKKVLNRTRKPRRPFQRAHLLRKNTKPKLSKIPKSPRRTSNLTTTTNQI